MPTAGRLIAAILFGALTWYVSEGARAYVPADETSRWITEINVVMAIIIAWVFMGSRVGQGFVPSMGYGITTAFLIWLWVLFANCFGEMISKSLRNQYDGPTEAVVAVFELMVEFGEKLFWNQEIIATMVIGGLVAGILTEEIGRRASSS